MSDLIRTPWLAGSVHKALTAWRTKKESTQPPREYSISPDGDLLLQGTKKGALQLTKFLTYENPLTAQLSDKYHYIGCEFTPTCRSQFEAEQGKDLLKIKGALIRLQEYEIQFVGSDGSLSEKGITFGDQLGVRGARAGGTRRSFTRSSEHHSRQIPVPVFVVQKFLLLACEGESIWGTPKTIRANSELETLLSELPRRKITVVNGSGERDRKPRQPVRQVSGDREVTGDRGGGDDDDEDEDTQPFATQAPNKFSSTFDNFEFETRSQFRAGTSTGSRLSGDSLPSSLCVPRKSSRPLKRKEIGFEVLLEKPAVQPKVRPTAKLQKSHNSGVFGHNSTNDSLVLHPGWQGMTEVTKVDSTVPEDQEMELAKEAAWYPPQSEIKSPHSSAFDVPKNRSTWEKHQPQRIVSRKHTARKTCVPRQKYPPDPVESEDAESSVSWPSSPEHQDPRFIGRGVTGTPPHSSMMSPVPSLGPSVIQALEGGSDGSVLKTLIESGDSPALPENKGSQRPASDKNSNRRGRASGKDNSPSLSRGPTKRVTRGANGISKRVLPDPTNSVFQRPRRRPKPKRISYNSADNSEDPEEAGHSDQSSGYRVREFSVEPPVPVIDPHGLTRVAKYGILGAQKVELWDKDRRSAKRSDVGSEPISEDDSFSDISFSTRDKLEDLATFKPNSQSGAEDRFSKSMSNHCHEEGLHPTSCDVPPSPEFNPMQSLLLSDPDSNTVGGKVTSINLKGNAESFKALLETGHNEEPGMSDDENEVPQQQQTPLPFRTSFVMAPSSTKQQGGQKKAVLSPELSANPTKPSYDQQLDKGKHLIRLEEEGALRNGSGLVASERVSLDAEDMCHLSSPVPAATVQVKETPYRGDGQPFSVRERPVCMSDGSNREGIPGTEDPPSTIQVPDSSQDRVLRENLKYRGALEVQVPASSDEVRMQKRDTPAALSKSVERVPANSGEILGSKEADIPKALGKHKKGLTDSPMSAQSAKRAASPFSPAAKRDKVPKAALSTSVPRALSVELTNLESTSSVRTKAASIIVISSDEEVPAPTPPKPVNLREYLRTNRTISDEIAKNKEQLKPEMYAGIRSRSLHIPGQEDKTKAEKRSGDERRKKYFGTGQARPWNNPWKPVGELARLEKDRLEKEAKLEEDSSSKSSAKPKGVLAAEDWFHDPDTPVKVFLRKLKGLKQVKNDDAGVGAEESHADR
ncbi:hypothetical protein C7212DRAFT_343236 [Tuber magnatum]|uniref:Shelterin complex subunit TPP1/Est3 domain-containing protein n=1 Tax=Tuber magnatum TaxID=42249 RepID=A0A317SVK8_9PEZI|nr:hypothetical protein C7212DRAFT_343236 [Tuber magnatum]